MSKKQKGFEVPTAYGTITAVESPDPEAPGVVVMFLDAQGTECTSCSLRIEESSDFPNTGHAAVMNVYGGPECDNVIYSYAVSTQKPKET